MTFTLPSHLFHIEEEDDTPTCIARQEHEEENRTAMKLTDISYEYIQYASMTELYNISNLAGVEDDEKLSHSEDLRQRLILMKRKIEGKHHDWKPLFKSVQSETRAKIDPLVNIMVAVEDTFQTIPTDSLSEILQKEGHLQNRNLLDEISTRMKNLKERRSLVVVAGETNGGKSTFLNLLLGEDILPTYVLHCTFAITKIVYSKEYSIKTLDHNDEEEYFPCQSRDEVIAILKSKVTQDQMKEREVESAVKEITLGLPADILKSGVVLVDTPGIGENETLDSVTMNFVKSTHASAFIYIIKSDTAGGVQEDRLISFLQAIKERYSTDAMIEAFDPKAAMFVCHRWDNIKDHEKVRMNALSKLKNVWPGFDASQMYTFSTFDTMKHLPVDPVYVTDSYMTLLKGLKMLFDRACHNAIKHQYLWLKYMLHPASQHLKSMITHCILSNEELEDYFQSVSVKQNKLMISSTENSKKLQAALDIMLLDLRTKISHNLDFGTSNPVLEIPECEEMIEMCSKENFLVCQANRQTLDEIVVQRLLRRVDDFVNVENIVSEMESTILTNIQDHLGLFKCQITQIQHAMLNEVNLKQSPSRPDLSFDGSSKQLRSSNESIATTGSSSSSFDSFKHIHSHGPQQLSQMIKTLLVTRKDGKSTKGTIANLRHEIGQTLFGKIGDKLKNRVFSKADPKVYVDERIQKLSKDIRENPEIMDLIVNGYTEWIQQYVAYAVESIPRFIEVNTKLMEEIREHRAIFQCNKDHLVKIMEDLEPCRHNIRGYGLLYMNDINAEALTYSTDHRTSTLKLPIELLTGSSRRLDSSFHEYSCCLWSRLEEATIEIDNVPSKVIIKTYTVDLNEKLVLPEIASLRFLDHTNLAPFLGMTRICAENSTSNTSSTEPDSSLMDKVSAFIFKGDLISARKFSQMPTFSSQQLLPGMIHSLLQGLNYIHREGLVHMELNLKTVMVDKLTGMVKLCHMCKPREATFPEDLGTPTQSYIYLSPSVLQENLYESTDDIYAFGLLLWELMFPHKLPYKDQRLWPLKEFIEKCHPSNMLQKDLNDLKVSDDIYEVLKGTLLISRGHIFMSLGKIQSLLENLNNNLPVQCSTKGLEKNVENMDERVFIQTPQLQVISPSGTGVKIEFVYDGSPNTTEDSSDQDPPIAAYQQSYSSSQRKLSSLLGEDTHTIQEAISLSKRRTSEPDILNYIPTPTKTSKTISKSKPVTFMRKIFKIGPSKKKNLGEELKPSLDGNIINSNSIRPAKLKFQELDKTKRNSVELECSSPQIRPKNHLSDERNNENTSDLTSYKTRNSAPNQTVFGSKSGFLTRKESFDVPKLMSEKFGYSIERKLSSNDVSRLDPLSGLNSGYLSGSMPSLVFASGSVGHNGVTPSNQQQFARFLASSSNPRMQTQLPLNTNDRKKRTSAPQPSSLIVNQQQQPSASLLTDLTNNQAPHYKSYLGSTSNLQKNSSPKATSSLMYKTKYSGSASNLYDMNIQSPFFGVSSVKSQQNPNMLRSCPISPLTFPSENVSMQLNLQSIPSVAVTDTDNSEIPFITQLSSSTSSHLADSGFSNDASVPEYNDLLELKDDLPSTSISFEDIDLHHTRQQNVETISFSGKVNKTNHFTAIDSKEGLSDCNDEDSVTKETEKIIEKRISTSLFNFNDFSHEPVHQQKSEPLCDTRRNSTIPPPPPPLNLADISFNFDNYGDYDSDE